MPLPDVGEMHRPFPGGDVLVIDDHPDTLEAMTRLVERLGFQVTGAASLNDAIGALARRGDVPFCLVLTDIGLPDGSGLRIPALLRESFPNHRVPALALSGYGMKRDVAASLAAGFLEHLVKPITHQQLSEAIGRNIRPLVDPAPRP